MSIDFSSQRQSYQKDTLLENDLPNTPFGLIEQWVKQAVEYGIFEPYAFSLATADKDGCPSVRTLLMRELNNDNGGVQAVFYTNYDSQKGKDLAQNPQAEALFFWADLERQVRIRGFVKKLDTQKSKAYFDSRPTDSKISAWVSTPQSGVVASRDEMTQKFDRLSEQFGCDVPYPEFWGGFVLIATRVEFWQGRQGRLHDRIVYRQDNNQWVHERLLP